MEFDLTRLLSNIDKEVVVDSTCSFSEEELKNTGILKLDNVSVKGNITKDNLNNINVDLNISGVMTLPCSLTLEPVDYKFETNVIGNVEEMLEDLDKFSKKVQNSLDILPIIWENILMEIPSRVVSPKAKDMKTSGDGWKIIEDEEVVENPELAKLKDLL